MKGTNLPSTLTSMFRNIALLTHFLRQRFLILPLFSQFLKISRNFSQNFTNVFSKFQRIFSKMSSIFFQNFTKHFSKFRQIFFYFTIVLKILQNFSQHFSPNFPQIFIHIIPNYYQIFLTNCSQYFPKFLKFHKIFLNVFRQLFHKSSSTFFQIITKLF